MTHRFDITKTLLSALGYKGTFYPGIFANTKFPITQGGKYYVEGDFVDNMPRDFTPGGRQIRTENARGEVTFMPIKIDGIELPNAIIGITGKKTINETPLVGGRGSVKELISVDDYEITLAGVLVSDDGQYPEKLIETFRDIWQKNESVTLLSAISDMVLVDLGKTPRTTDVNVVLKSIDFPAVGAFENAQIITLTAVSDYPFTLIID